MDDLVINTRGAYLKKQNNCFVVKTDKITEISVGKVKSILITTSAFLSTDAIKLAVDNNIDIIFLDYNGTPYGRVWHSKPGSTALIRRKQLEISEKEKGLKLAGQWSIEKIETQIETLNKLKSTRPQVKEEFDKNINKMNNLKEKFQKLKGTIEEKRQTMMGLEGMCAKIYFSSIKQIMPEKFKFNGRSRNPAKDEFNCLLNYGYGVLYSKVEKACIIAGLDPYIGFVHTDNYNKKSLVFDLIEPFRYLADRTVLYLFSKKLVKKEHFDKLQNGLSLNKKGKEVLIKQLNETFEKQIKYNGRNIKMKNIIQYRCHKIANELIGK